jgi:hypothetical protein
MNPRTASPGDPQYLAKRSEDLVGANTGSARKRTGRELRHQVWRNSRIYRRGEQLRCARVP